MGVAVEAPAPVVRVAALLLLVPLALLMGTRLHVGGHRTGIPLPWATIDSLPLLESAGAQPLHAPRANSAAPR
jgi:hypothetical protein